MTTPDENKEIVQRVLFDTYEGKEDLDIVDEFVSDEYVLHDFLSGEDYHGPDGLKEHIEAGRNATADLTQTLHHMVAEDDIVAVRFTSEGILEAAPPGLDIDPTGEEFEVDGMEFDRLEDGKLVETWLTGDTLGFMHQIGALPSEEVAPAQ